MSPLEAINLLDRACKGLSYDACPTIAALVRAGGHAELVLEDGGDGLRLVIRIDHIRSLSR